MIIEDSLAVVYIASVITIGFMEKEINKKIILKCNIYNEGTNIF